MDFEEKYCACCHRWFRSSVLFGTEDVVFNFITQEYEVWYTCPYCHNVWMGD